MDLTEARRLISEAGYRPYIRKVKGKAYITLIVEAGRLALDLSAKMFGTAPVRMEHSHVRLQEHCGISARPDA